MPLHTIHTRGRDQWTPHRPSGLTRVERDGRQLLPMEEDRARLTPLRFIGQVALLAACFVVVTLAVAVLP